MKCMTESEFRRWKKMGDSGDTICSDCTEEYRNEHKDQCVCSDKMFNRLKMLNGDKNYKRPEEVESALNTFRGVMNESTAF